MVIPSALAPTGHQDGSMDSISTGSVAPSFSEKITTGSDAKSTCGSSAASSNAVTANSPLVGMITAARKTSRFPFDDVPVAPNGRKDLVWSLSGRPRFDEVGRFLGFRGGALTLGAGALNLLRVFDQPLGGVRPAVEDHVFDQLAQRRVEFFVDAELPGIDDAHRHARADRVVQERGVHRFAHRVVAAERERHVAHAPTTESGTTASPSNGLRSASPSAVALPAGAARDHGQGRRAEPGLLLCREPDRRSYGGR